MYQKKHNQCKACRAKKQKEYRANGKGKEVSQKYDNKPRVKAAKLEYMKGYYKSKPFYMKASSAVTQAIRSGQMVRGCCEVCGNPETEGHHDDYNKLLNVRWLCKLHHEEWHTKHEPIYP